MGMVIRWFWFLMVIVSGFRSSQAQQELDYIDPEDMIHADWLLNQWMLACDSFSSADSAHRWPLRYAGQQILSASLRADSLPVELRSRTLVHSGNARFSWLAKQDLISSGMEFSPDRHPIRILFGDYQFSAGQGMTFTNRYHFDSWTVDPHQRLVRSGGLKLSTTSSSDRYLRGGGLRWQTGPLEMQGFFSNRVAGADLALHQMNYSAGILCVQVDGEEIRQIRTGTWVLFRLRQALVFGEIGLQNGLQAAGEAGLSWFGSDRHAFFYSFRYVSPHFDPEYTRLRYSRPREHDQAISLLHYQWQVNRRLKVHAEWQSASGLRPADNGDYFPDQFSLRAGLKKDWDSGAVLLVRYSFKSESSKWMVRWRQPIGEMNYIQAEVGYSLRSLRTEADGQNRYAGLDFCAELFRGKLRFCGGCCYHSGDPGSVLLYRYEPDLFYQMSLPVLSGKGLTGYLRLKYHLNQHLICEAKLRKTVGYAENPAEQSRKIQLQLIYRPVWYR